MFDGQIYVRFFHCFRISPLVPFPTQVVDDLVDCLCLLIDVPPPPKHILLFHLIHFGRLVGKFPLCLIV